VFLFMIDNIQETFGIAPLEAMAAGLPLLVSDWDGLKDTVSDDVGFRVTSRTLTAPGLAQEALRHMGGIDSYVQYGAAVSALTEIDMGELTARIVELARDPGLRRRMGAAARRRAREVYDWRHIIPQMQAFWAEQSARREAGAATALGFPADAVPVAPSPTGLFAAFPTEQTSHDGVRFLAADPTGRPGLNEVLKLRNYHGMHRMFADTAHIAQVLARLGAAGEGGMNAATLARQTGLSRYWVDRIVIWLLKYGFARRV
jgi:hypothetical protein